MSVCERAERTAQILVVRFGNVVAAFLVGELFASAKLAQFCKAFCCHGNLLDVIVSLICADPYIFIRAERAEQKSCDKNLQSRRDSDTIIDVWAR